MLTPVRDIDLIAVLSAAQGIPRLQVRCHTCNGILAKPNRNWTPAICQSCKAKALRFNARKRAMR